MESYLQFSEKEKEERYKRARNAILDKYDTYAEYERKTGTPKRRPVGKFINSSTICEYLNFCRDLRLDPYDLIAIDSYYENRKENILENRLLSLYCVLNRDGRERLLELLEDVVSIDKYRRV